MTRHNDQRPCCGTPQGNERRLEDMGYGREDRAILTIARLYFLSFADPFTQGWMRAGAVARHTFGASRGPQVAAAVLDAVLEMQTARRAVFEFSNPDSAGCAQVVCESERQFMGAMQACRAGRMSTAHANVLLLCEGADSGPLLSALRSLGGLLDEAPERATSVPAQH